MSIHFEVKKPKHSNKAKLLKILIAVIITTYMFSWVVAYSFYVNKYNTYKENISTLNKITSQNLTDNVPRPILLSPLILNNINELTKTNIELSDTLQIEAKKITQELQILLVDALDLQGQLTYLDLTIDEGVGTFSPATDNIIPIEPSAILELFSKKVQTEKYFDTAKTNIADLFAQNTEKQIFANPLWGKTEREITEIIDSMTSKQKAGQLLMFSISEQSINQNLTKNLQEIGPAGIILMGNNIANASQLKKLSAGLQGTNSQFPLLIATDQEGGVVKRIYWDTTSGQNAWANMSETELCSQAKERSSILYDGGINLNFSPVVDLSNTSGGYINNRTISSNPETVIEKAQIYIDCSLEENVFTTLKHYPGHGTTTEDSHYKLPSTNESKTDWLAHDALPFARIENSKAIMVGHLLFKNIAPDNPATLSKTLLTDILQQEIKYKGLIITDDMNMLHTSTKISVKDALLKSINAGVDIVLYVGLPTSKENILDTLTQLIENQEISTDRVNESLLKILNTKRDLK